MCQNRFIILSIDHVSLSLKCRPRSFHRELLILCRNTGTWAFGAQWRGFWDYAHLEGPAAIKFQLLNALYVVSKPALEPKLRDFVLGGRLHSQNSKLFRPFKSATRLPVPPILGEGFWARLSEIPLLFGGEGFETTSINLF